jgi:hypothetical protein
VIAGTTNQEGLEVKDNRIEEWTSSEGRTEIHYFRAEDDEYLFGYNPLIIPEHLLHALQTWAYEIH